MFAFGLLSQSHSLSHQLITNCRSEQRMLVHSNVKQNIPFMCKRLRCQRIQVLHRRTLSQLRRYRRGSHKDPRQLIQCRSAQVVHVATAEDVSAFQELSTGTARKYIMVSGKGGVGKTSLAASLAVQLSAAGHTTLVVSTDPAHSLSDSLDQDVSGGKPVLLEGSDLPLWGMEIDPEEAKKEFFAYSGGSGKQEASELMGGMGLGGFIEQLADLKLGELLNTPPPGFDEAVAISKVVQFVKAEEYARFSRIVFDTAPTGHTLRFLAVPEFVDASLEKLVRLRRQLSGASSAIRGLFGASEQQDAVVQKLENLQSSIRLVRDLFRDKDATELIIATIPTILGINESSRLLAALQKEGVPCKRIVVNQIIGPSMGDTYLRMKLKDQEGALKLLDSDPTLRSLRHVKAPYVDREVRGLAGLQYFGTLLWKETIEEMQAGSSRKYYMLGGKGGVGKTSSAASLAVQLSAAGHTTLVVSTDPAHSLSDSLDQDVSGGVPVSLEGTSLPLWGMELDIEQAKQELKELAGKNNGSGTENFLSGLGLGGVAEQLKDLNLSELLDTPPPGLDEIVAIAKVVQFLKNEKYAKFSRIVFDTAPTGHTLRLLTLPDFLDASIGKVVRLRQKLLDLKDSVTGIFGVKSEKDSAVQKLEELKEQMEAARQLFRNHSTTEFVIVSIPTVMAMVESSRLAAALKAEDILVKTILVNQVVRDDATQKFLGIRRKDQQRALQILKEDPALRELELIEAPLVDLEVRGLPALTYFGGKVWK